MIPGKCLATFALDSLSLEPGLEPSLAAFALLCSPPEKLPTQTLCFFIFVPVPPGVWGHKRLGMSRGSVRQRRSSRIVLV